jgi:signal recognition particle GTPase
MEQKRKEISMKMKGYLVIDDVSLEEAEQIMKQLKKSGRWLSVEARKKIDGAISFAVLTHNFPAVQPHEVVEFKNGTFCTKGDRNKL